MLEEFKNVWCYGKQRGDMPQIRYTDLHLFKKYLDHLGITNSFELHIIDLLDPMQDKFHRSKVDKRKETYSPFGVVKPFIVSTDLMILDGHNTYQVLVEMEHEFHVMCFVVELPPEELINVATNFPLSFKEDWDQITGG